MAIRNYVRGWNSFKAALWLAWKIESNWTSPPLFILFCVIKPVSFLLIITFMFKFAIGGSTFDVNYFSFFFIGAVLYIYVSNILSSMANVIFEDREHYEVIKYVYISPLNFYAYFLSYGLIRFLLATISVSISFWGGYLFLGLNPFNVLKSLNLFVISSAAAVASIFFCGVIIGSLTLLTARNATLISETAAGFFMILCGALFPLHYLPEFLRQISVKIPISQWFEISRRIMSATATTIDRTWQNYTSDQLLYEQLFFCLCLFIISMAVFKFANLSARARGIIDSTTNY